MNKKLEYVKSELEVMYAVEMLEYHNKNYLSGDNKSRSEGRQEQLLSVMKSLKELNDQLRS